MLDRLFRLIVVIAVLAAVAVGVWWSYSSMQLFRLREELALLQAEMEARLAEKQAMIERLGRDHRKAVIEVREQVVDAEGVVLETTIDFIEIDPDGKELGRLTATVPGDTIHIDAWVAKFERSLVAEGHPLMGRTLVLLRSVYSSRLAPEAGIPIDTPGAVPAGYAASESAVFERRLWESFWTIARDPKLARAFGLRAAQGESVYRPVRTGDTLELLVEAAGGMSLVPGPLRGGGAAARPGVPAAGPGVPAAGP